MIHLPIVNKIDKPPANLIKKKKEKTQIQTIRNEKVEITTYTAEIQRIINNYFENLYSQKIEDTDEMNRCLEKYKLPKLNEEDITTLNNPIIANEIWNVIKSLLTKKSPGPDGFPTEFHKKFMEDLIPTLLKLFNKIEKETILPKSFLEASITLIPKPERDATKKENYRLFSHEYRCKNPQ